MYNNHAITKDERIAWKENENLVEISFEFYLSLLERRLRGENVSLVEEMQSFFKNELNISVRKTQIRGLMHNKTSVYINYIASITGKTFEPGSQIWDERGLKNSLNGRNIGKLSKIQKLWILKN